MKAAAVEIESYFDALKGARPWRVRRGHGSFLTFDFGQRVLRGGHMQGQWRLWIYLSNWLLTRDGRALANSDSDHHVIEVAVRRLEQAALTGVEFNADQSPTTFIFEDFRLRVSPADYLDNPDHRDEYWLLFTPDGKVLGAGPTGVRVRPANAA
jgi:hypothetical protein